MIGKILSFMAAAAMVSVTPAVAQAADAKKKSAKDPNEVVCEKQEVLGSRVATKRICMTRSEWAEKRRLERLEIDKAQVNRGSCEGCQ
ncbi:MAG: hypothetical protein LOX97_07575 [Sphingomonas sp.]|nr:hypothetical protein [Sphingomonas sp.]